MSSDPFLTVQSDVLSTLDSTRSLFSSYLRIRSHATSPNSPELLQSRTELESTLSDLTTDLSDLIESVKAIEQDPYRFGLDVIEVERRRRLVEDVGKEVDRMRTELDSAVSSAPNKGKAGTSHTSSSNLPHPSDFVDDADPEDDYEAWEQQRQTEMMAEQDEQLDGVFQTVGNLRQQADDMGRELEEQAGMLEEVDTVAERVGGKLAGGLKRVGWVIKRNEGMCYDCCLGSLEMTRLGTRGGLIETLMGVCGRHDVQLLHCGSDIRVNHTVDSGDRGMIVLATTNTTTR